MFILRPAKMSDLDDMVTLANLAGSGLISLPKDANKMQAKLEKSVFEFEHKVNRPSTTILVLEDLSIGKVVGTTAIKTTYVNPLFCWHPDSNSSATLFPDGFSELGGSFLKAEYRNGKLGKFLSQMRVAFLVFNADRYSHNIISCIRGYQKNDENQFFNHVWTEYNHLTFDIVNDMFAQDPFGFFPASKGVEHKIRNEFAGMPMTESIPAMQILKKLGLVQLNYIDLIDGGPIFASHINTLKGMAAFTPKVVYLDELIEESTDMGVSIILNSGFSTFAAITSASACELKGFLTQGKQYEFIDII